MYKKKCYVIIVACWSSFATSAPGCTLHLVAGRQCTVAELAGSVRVRRRLVLELGGTQAGD